MELSSIGAAHESTFWGAVRDQVRIRLLLSASHVVNAYIISCAWVATACAPETSRRRERCYAELSF